MYHNTFSLIALRVTAQGRKEGNMTQKEEVLAHLKAYGKITALEAIQEYGITRLSAVVWRLRNDDGYNITSQLKSGINRKNEQVWYTEYHYKPIEN